MWPEGKAPDGYASALDQARNQFTLFRERFIALGVEAAEAAGAFTEMARAEADAEIERALEWVLNPEPF